MNKLVKILKLLECCNQQELEALNEIEIIDEKRILNEYVFSIVLNQVLDPNLFVRIRNIDYDDIKIKIKVIAVKKIKNHDIDPYLNYIADQNPHLYYFKKIIECKYYDFDYLSQSIEFKYANESERDEINQVLKMIVDLVSSAFGFSTFHYELVENTEFIERMQQKQEFLEKQKKEAIKKHQEKAINNEQQETKKKNFKVNNSSIIELDNLINGMNNINVQGEIFKIDVKDSPKAKITKIYIYDYKTTFCLKHIIFPTINENKKNNNDDFIKTLKNGDWIIATVDIKSDNFDPEIYGMIKRIEKIDKPSAFIRSDLSNEKRIELTNHTKMSAFDGIIETDQLVNLAKQFNHEAVACTDRYNLQSFPEFQKACEKNNIKPIYGVEMCVLPPTKLVLNETDIEIDKMSYVVFDLETTGLNAAIDDIIEFGAIKYENGVQVANVQFFIKPNKPINETTTEITGITDDDVKNAINQEEGIKKIIEFIKDLPLIAHNAINFDFRFLCAKASKYLDLELKNTVIDTLHIVRAIYPSWKSHTLQKTCKEFLIDYGEDEAHRANYDAMVLNYCWNVILEEFKKLNIKKVSDINGKLDSNKLKAMYHSDFVYVYPKNNEGLKKLNELVSISYTTNLYNEPKILYETLEMNRENLLLCPSPVEGEVMFVALNGTDKELKKVISKYDFIFVASPDNFLPYIYKNELSRDTIEQAIKKIINFSIEQNKKVIAVGDCYYLNEWDKKFQEVYLYTKALNGKRHRYFRYKMLPNQHFRSTLEMINEFKFLKDEALINEIVVTNAHIFNALIANDIKPIKQGLFAPKMDNVDELLKNKVYETAHEKYGPNLPQEVQDRLNKELDSIITHGFSVIYWISHLLVKKSYQDGYTVGSRGSVGSSLVATMLKITDVNPLAPHYICDQCKHTEFRNDVDDGFDLIPTKCPACEHGTMYGEGHDIPFETFLGFKGDKVPDIDLNFSGLYQAKAHNFIKEIFGEKHAFRAGTISKVAEKTCYSIVREYFNETLQNDIKISLIDLYAKKCENVKRTTGQHPGGILIIPKEYSVYDFTPYNYPADDKTSDWFTTHYAFEFLHDNLLKFDILGHDNPTILRRLKDLTGVDEANVPHYDKNVMELFNSIKPLAMDEEANFKNGAITIPEFGTKFVREMLDDTHPQNFADLIRISGLSHGTNVYLGNAKDLIKKKNLKLKDVIACRDDIMIYLINKGLDHSTSFKIMEDVRKGKKLKPEYEKIMIEHNVPNWYIDSCNKIEYMFPKAHACAYVMHAWKFAWYKLYHPLAYYSIFLSIKSDSIDLEIVTKGKEAIKQRISDINKMANDKTKANDLKKKDLDSLVILEVCLEMSYRNIKIKRPDIFLSDATEFTIYNNEIIAPFNAIDGIGDDVAKSIIEARNEKPFVSVDDVIKRTKLNKTNISKLEELGVFENLPKSGQVSLFDL